MISRIIMCNWKMYLTHNQSLSWFSAHQDELTALMSESKHTVVIYPSYESIAPLAAKCTSNPRLHIGAQDCSAHSFGAYSGDVSAQSLKEIGATYTLVGHSETRKNQKNTNETTALKTIQALEQNLIPVVCIGETRDKYLAGTTLNVIEEQIRPILELSKHHNKELAIAYEPVWAIGTNELPSKDHLEKVFQYILKKCKRLDIERVPLLLYGGSVDDITIGDLVKVTEIQGFLIGKASIDFQKFKKIVQSIYSDR